MRDFDVIVYGASGYTGRQVVSHLERLAPERTLRWAVSGRDRDKLASIPELSSARPVLVADGHDAAALAALARRTRAVVNLAGPYARRAEPLMTACIAAGTHYADLCGELPFMRDVITRHHEAAVRAGVKVLMACGFESLPFDFLVSAFDTRFAELDGSRCQDVELRVEYVVRPAALLGGHNMTGGTIATMLSMTDLDGPCDVCDTSALSPHHRGPAAPIELAVRRREGRWLAPVFPLPFINPAVIHRSAALAGGYAENFRYREAFDLSSFVRPSPLAALVAHGCAALMQRLAAMARGRREWLDRVLAWALARAAPAPGRGPALPALDGMDYRLVALARSDSGRTLDGTLHAKGHPGYRSSASIIAEAGIALARDTSAGEPGVVTPVVGLGQQFRQHFAAAGLALALNG